MYIFSSYIMSSISRPVISRGRRSRRPVYPIQLYRIRKCISSPVISRRRGRSPVYPVGGFCPIFRVYPV